jgi:hypothetical protein
MKMTTIEGLYGKTPLKFRITKANGDNVSPKMKEELTAILKDLRNDKKLVDELEQANMSIEALNLEIEGLVSACAEKDHERSVIDRVLVVMQEKENELYSKVTALEEANAAYEVNNKGVAFLAILFGLTTFALAVSTVLLLINRFAQ